MQKLFFNSINLVFSLFLLSNSVTPLTAQHETLELEGAIKLDTASLAEEGTIQYKDGNFEGRTSTGWKPFANRWQEDGNTLYYKEGRVGIGTTSSPNSQLTIETEEQIGISINSSSGTWADFHLNAAKSGATPRYTYARQSIFKGSHEVNADNDWQLSLFDTASAQSQVRLHVGDQGKVGVGTDTPTAQVTVETNDEVGLLINGKNTEQSLVQINAEQDTANTSISYLKNGILKGIHGLNSANDWELKLLDPSFGGTIESRLFIDNEGRVGIGTNEPYHSLHIYNNDSYTDLRLTGSDNAAIEFETLYDDSHVALQSAENFFDFLNLNSFPYDFLFTININDKKIGINERDPTHTLLVNGDAAKPGGGNWSVASDRRLKTDIQPYSDGLDNLMKINPVTFRYNGQMNLPTDKEYVGIIAQEMQKVAPYMIEEKEYVKTDRARNRNEPATPKPDENNRKEGQKFLSFDGSALTFMLINSVQEQQATILQLNENIGAMNETMTILRKRIEELEKNR